VKPFRFNLEKVLKVRQLETLKAKQALAEAQLLAGQAWAASEQARAARVAFEGEMERRRSRRITAGEWAALSEQHDQLTAREKEAARRLHEALALVAERRSQLEEAQRREKALEKLREQQFEAYLHEEQLAEQAEVDEMAQNLSRAQKGVG
jgi:flagellar FliJ protein